MKFEFGAEFFSHFDVGFTKDMFSVILNGDDVCNPSGS